MSEFNSKKANRRNLNQKTKITTTVMGFIFALLIFGVVLHSILSHKNKVQERQVANIQNTQHIDLTQVQETLIHSQNQIFKNIENSIEVLDSELNSQNEKNHFSLRLIQFSSEQCEELPHLRFNFESLNLMVSGEIPEFALVVKCEWGQDPQIIKPYVFNKNLIRKQKNRDGQIDFIDEGFQIIQKNAADTWTSYWKLKSIEFINKKNEVEKTIQLRSHEKIILL